MLFRSARREAGDKVVAAENALTEADRHLKQAERELAEKREARVRAEGAVAQAEDTVQRLIQAIREKLECEPDQVLEQADLKEGEAPAPEEELLHKEQRLVREREQIGPVNLRAEEEMRELDEQIAGLKNEQWRRVASPFGETSDEFLFGELEGQQVVFVPRHGRGHVHSPSSINYRANIDALKRVGVTDILSLSACGSLKENLPPGHFVIVDQFIEGRPPTDYFERIRAYDAQTS